MQPDSFIFSISFFSLFFSIFFLCLLQVRRVVIKSYRMPGRRPTKNKPTELWLSAFLPRAFVSDCNNIVLAMLELLLQFSLLLLAFFGFGWDWVLVFGVFFSLFFSSFFLFGSEIPVLKKAAAAVQPHHSTKAQP